MRKRTKTEVERAKIAKAVRTAVRLKHSVAADEEINEVLPVVLKEFDQAIAAGKPFELDVRSVFDGS